MSAASTLLDRVRHPRIFDVAAAEPDGSLEDFAGHKYCVAVTYRRSGASVATPVWFGIDGGRVYFVTDADSGKARRIRADGRIRLAPSTARGKPRGHPLEGIARILPPEGHTAAEAVIAANYGLGRRIYRRLLGARADGAAYVEVTLQK